MNIRELLKYLKQLDRTNLADRLQLADLLEENDCLGMAGVLRDTSDLWVWMPHPAHFICASECKFHLATYVPSGYIVSTVGEYLVPEGAWDVLAESRGVKLTGLRGDAKKAKWIKDVGWEDVGWNRKYETMVFPAVKRGEDNKASLCCPWEIDLGHDLEMDGYNDSMSAYQGHLALCRKWSLEPAWVKPLEQPED